MFSVRATLGRSRLSRVVFISLLTGMMAIGVTGAGPALAAPGDLDTTFSGDGIVTTGTPGPTGGRGVEVLPDGRIVVGGAAGNNADFQVSIYLPNGTLDPNFSTDGKATFDIGATDDVAEAVAIMIENDVPRIIAAGSSGGQMALIKIKPEITTTASDTEYLDSGFGTAGVAKTTGLVTGFGHDVVVNNADSNKIIVAGSTNSATGKDFALAGFTSSGSPDTTWGALGLVVTNNPLNILDDEAFGVTIHPAAGSYRVVAAGVTNNRAPLDTDPNFNVAVARYLSTGTLDATFSSDGWSESEGSSGAEDRAFDVKIQPSVSGALPGKIVVAGFTRADGSTISSMFVVRYGEEGGEDTEFGSGTGKQTVDLPLGSSDAGRNSFARALDVQLNRKLVITGASLAGATSTYDFALARLNPDGGLDNTFSGDGVLATSLSNSLDDAYDSVLQPDGKIVVTGDTGNPVSIGVVRYIGDPIAFLSGPVPTTEGNSGLKNFTFTVTTSAAVPTDYAVEFVTSPEGTTTECEATSTSTACDYNRVSQRITIAANTTSTTVDVPVRGDTKVESNELFKATLSTLPGNGPTGSGPAVVTPQTSRNTATATILNDDGDELRIGDAVPAFEGASGVTQTFTFSVTQTFQNLPGVTTSVQYATAPDTATAGTDYLSTSGTAYIGPGQNSTQVTVTVNGDADVEPDERFFVNLAEGSPACEGTPCFTPTIADGQGVGTIQDDDDTSAPPRLSIGDVELDEGNSGTTPFEFTVTMTGNSTSNVTVTYRTDDCEGTACGTAGKASVPGDYTATTGTVVFEPGSGTRTRLVTVTVNGDTAPEFDEVFKVTITFEGTATVDDAEGVGKIMNDDDGGGGDPDPDPDPGGGSGPSGPVFTESLGGVLIGGPDAASWSEDHMSVFVIGSDKALWQNSWTGFGWTGWSSLGGSFNADPTVVSWGQDRLDVFGRGADNALWHASYNGSSWSAWETLGGFITSAPDASSTGSGRLDVFAKGGDDALWQNSWTGSGWSGWTSLGGIITSDPTAVSWGADRIDLFGRGADNALWQRSWNGSSWSGWSTLGGILNGGPDAASTAPGILDVFVIGSDKAAWRNTFINGSWTGWGTWGGVFTSDPTAVSMDPDSLDMFARGGDNALWHKWQDGGS